MNKKISTHIVSAMVVAAAFTIGACSKANPPPGGQVCSTNDECSTGYSCDPAQKICVADDGGLINFGDGQAAKDGSSKGDASHQHDGAVSKDAATDAAVGDGAQTFPDLNPLSDGSFACGSEASAACGKEAFCKGGQCRCNNDCPYNGGCNCLVTCGAKTCGVNQICNSNTACECKPGWKDCGMDGNCECDLSTGKMCQGFGTKQFCDLPKRVYENSCVEIWDVICTWDEATT